MPEPSIWDKVDLSVLVASTAQASEETPAEEPKKEGRRPPFWLLDVAATLLWLFFLTKLFVLDVDREFLETVASDYAWLVNFRFFFYLGAAIVLVLVVRGWNWLLLGYVLFFPFIVVLWKIPRALYRTGSWIPVLALLNALASFFADFRRNFVTRALAVFAILAIVVSTTAVVVIPAATYLAVLLLLAYYRTVRNTFSFSQFLRLQQRLIVETAESKFVVDLMTLNDKLKSDSIVKFNAGQLQMFSQSLAWGALANRIIYFWAYQLERYRQSSATLFFSALSYVWLYGLTILTFSMLNLGVLHVAPDQYTFVEEPSILRVVYYSMASLFVSGIADLEPVGDWAIAVQIAAGFAGPIVLGTLVLHLIVSARPSRRDADFRETIADIKSQARDLESRLRTDFEVTVEEALRRLNELGNAMVAWCLFFSDRMPEGFFDDEGRPSA